MQIVQLVSECRILQYVASRLESRMKYVPVGFGYGVAVDSQKGDGAVVQKVGSTKDSSITSNGHD
eukprot:scaffold367680_cov47-Attheya_sp.AAC.4